MYFLRHGFLIYTKLTTPLEVCCKQIFIHRSGVESNFYLVRLISALDVILTTVKNVLLFNDSCGSLSYLSDRKCFLEGSAYVGVKSTRLFTS